MRVIGLDIGTTTVCALVLDGETGEVLHSLGQMYTEDERFRRNIDQAGGEGTAAFVRQAIEAYCAKN